MPTKKSKRVGGEKISKLTITKTEQDLLERASDLLSDIMQLSEGKLNENAREAYAKTVQVRTYLSAPQEEPAHT